MNLYILIYEEFAQFEVIIPGYIGSAAANVVTVGLDLHPVRSFEGFTIIPDKQIGEITTADIDALVIPGGDPKHLWGNDQVYHLLRELDQQNKFIGGICGGVISLAKSGVLQDKNFTTSIDFHEYSEFDESRYVDDNVVIDGNIITAKAAGYVEFGIELGRILDLYEDDEDYKETVDFYMYFGAPEN